MRQYVHKATLWLQLAILSDLSLTEIPAWAKCGVFIFVSVSTLIAQAELITFKALVSTSQVEIFSAFKLINLYKQKQFFSQTTLIIPGRFCLPSAASALSSGAALVCTLRSLLHEALARFGSSLCQRFWHDQAHCVSCLTINGSKSWAHQNLGT